MVDAPMNLSFEAGEQSGLELSWEPVSGVSGYRVYRATTSGSAITDYTLIAEVLETSYRDTEVSKGQQYYYRVTSYVVSFQFSAPDTTDEKEGGGWDEGVWSSNGSPEDESAGSNEVSGVLEIGTTSTNATNSTSESTTAVESGSVASTANPIASGSADSLEEGRAAISTAILAAEFGVAVISPSRVAADSTPMAADKGESNERLSSSIQSFLEVQQESAFATESPQMEISAILSTAENGAVVENGAFALSVLANVDEFGSGGEGGIVSTIANSHLVELGAGEEDLSIDARSHISADERMVAVLTPEISGDGETVADLQFRESFPSELTRNLSWDYNDDRRGFESKWIHRDAEEGHGTVSLYIAGKFGQVDPASPTVIVDYDATGDGRVDERSDPQTVYTTDQPVTFPSLSGDTGYYRILLRDLRPPDILSAVIFGPSNT